MIHPSYVNERRHRRHKAAIRRKTGWRQIIHVDRAGVSIGLAWLLWRGAVLGEMSYVYSTASRKAAEAEGGAVQLGILSKADKAGVQLIMSTRLSK